MLIYLVFISLQTYVKNAKALLKASKEGTNPFEGYVPHVPHGERLSFQTPEFDEMEEKGLHELPHTAFVLVAGGLGERLGYQASHSSFRLHFLSSYQ